MCYKTVGFYLLILNFVSDLFVMNNMIEQFYSVVFPDDYVVFGHLDTDFVTFFINNICLNSISLSNINLDDKNFDYCDPETINHVRLVGWCKKCKQNKALKKR